MIKRILVALCLVVALLDCRAQQIFECKDFGFKFVIGYEFDGYEGNRIPVITYVAKGSPAERAGMIVGANLNYIIDADSVAKNLSGEKIMSQIAKRPYPCCMILYTSPGWELRGDPVYVNMMSDNIEFPQAKQAPVAGGKNLLGTCIRYCGKGDIKMIIYENGDVYTGKVINKVYPDPEYAAGKYIKFEDHVALLREKHLAKEKENEAARQKREDEKQQAARLLQEQQAAAIIKYRQDSIANLKPLSEIIKLLPATDHPLFGVGFDIRSAGGGWIITSVEKASGAWFCGIKEGDILTGIQTAPNFYGWSKQYIIQTLSGKFGEAKGITISRPAEGISSQNVFPMCLSIYKIPETLPHGGCLWGDCQDGEGLYLDDKGIYYSGKFSGDKLNSIQSYTDKMYNPKESLFVQSNFVNNMRNGYTSAYNNEGLISLSYTSSVVNMTGYSGNFKNDLPDGKITITKGFLNYYGAEYVNGVLQGKALKIIDTDHYTYCDVTPRFDVTNCVDHTGTPTEVLTARANSNAGVTTSNTNNTNVNTSKFGGENLIPNLRTSCQAMQNAEPGYTWYDGGPLTFEPSGVYDVEYVNITVPANKSMRVYFVMELGETDKVQFLPKSMSYMYENVEGGIPNGYSSDVGGVFYFQSFSITNKYTKEGRVMIEIRGRPSTEYVRRTIYYAWGISK